MRYIALFCLSKERNGVLKGSSDSRAREKMCVVLAGYYDHVLLEAGL